MRERQKLLHWLYKGLHSKCGCIVRSMLTCSAVCLIKGEVPCADSGNAEDAGRAEGGHQHAGEGQGGCNRGLS